MAPVLPDASGRYGAITFRPMVVHPASTPPFYPDGGTRGSTTKHWIYPPPTLIERGYHERSTLTPPCTRPVVAVQLLRIGHEGGPLGFAKSLLWRSTKMEIQL